MNGEIDAAAERVRRDAYETEIDESLRAVDRDRLIAAYLAETDPTPLTPELLVERFGGAMPHRLMWSFGKSSVQRDAGEWHYSDDFGGRVVRTCGDVATLLRMAGSTKGE